MNLERDPNQTKRLGRRRWSLLCLVALTIGLLGLAALTGAGVLSAPTADPGAPQPHVQAVPEYSQRWRFGVGVDRSSGSIDNYDISQLCMGWYSDWGTLENPPRPEGVEFVQLIRVGAKHFDLAQPETYNWASLNAKISANPGSLWLIGNEPDGSDREPACDALSPAEYATVYKIFYDHIKGVDPTAKLANGGIIQGSPVRMQWLTKVWDAYQAQNGGATMPVDVWNMHNQIVWERDTGGAYIPEDCDPSLAYSWLTLADVDNPQIFRDFVENMRRWMKDHGQQDKPLIISEFGMMQPEYDGFTVDRVNQYMTSTFLYLLSAKDPTLGMPTDENRLVQRWGWFSLNAPMGRLGFGGWNGNLFDRDTKAVTEFGRNYARLACSATHPTPTPNTTPLSSFVRREAEGGTLHGSMAIEQATSASGCRYVSAPTLGEGSEVVYNVFTQSTGNYVIWGRVQGLGYDDCSFNVQVDGGPVVAWKFSITNNWIWRRVSSIDPYYDPMIYQLQGPRWHTIKIGPRGGGKARLDLIEVTSNSGYQPGNGSIEACVLTPTPTTTNTGTPEPTSTPTLTDTPEPTNVPTITRTPMPTGPAGLSGRITYQGRGTPPAASWEDTVTISAHLPGDPIPAYSFSVSSGQDGRFALADGIKPDIYDVSVRGGHSLRNRWPNVVLSGAATPDLDMGTLVEGDANLDNKVSMADFSLLSTAYGARRGEIGYNGQTDFNNDGQISMLDFSLLSTSYGQEGDITVGNVVKSGQVYAADAANVEVLEDSISLSIKSDKTVGVNDTLTLDVNVSASASKLVDGADVKISFSTTYLEVTSVAGGGALPNEIKNSVSGSTIWYAAGKIGGSVNAPFLLCRITLKAKAATAGTALNFTSMEVTGPEGLTYAESGSGCTIVVQAATATPSPTYTHTPSITPTPSNTLAITKVPTPTKTPTLGGGALELVLREGVGGYSGFEDTYLDSWAPQANRGGEAGLRQRAVNERNILMRTDLSQLPPGTTVEQAVLTLYQIAGGDTPIEGRVYGVLRPWAEMEATWVDASASIPWAVAGCNGEGSDREAAFLSRRGLFPTWRNYDNYPFDFDVTSLVQRWVSDPASNKGLVVGSMEGALGELIFGSSEHPAEAARPRLLIRYRPGTGVTATPTPTSTVGPGPTPTHTPTDMVTATPTQTPGGQGRIQNNVFADANGDLAWDAHEPGVSGAAIELRNLSNVLLNSCFTGPNGICSFGNVTPGTYRVRLVSVPPGYVIIDPSLATWTFNVNAGGTMQVAFALRNQGTLTDRVRLPIVVRNQP